MIVATYRRKGARPPRAKLPSSSACKVLMDYFRGLDPAPPEKKTILRGTIRVASGQLPFELETPEPPCPCELDKAQADVVIAMAPHPVNSVLALTFDREIESTQRAAASAGQRQGGRRVEKRGRGRPQQRPRARTAAVSRPRARAGGAGARGLRRVTSIPPHSRRLCDDDAAMAVFRHHFGTDARVAVLSESGTEFGGQGFGSIPVI